VTAQEGHWCI